MKTLSVASYQFEGCDTDKKNKHFNQLKKIATQK